MRDTRIALNLGALIRASRCPKPGCLWPTHTCNMSAARPRPGVNLHEVCGERERFLAMSKCVGAGPKPARPLNHRARCHIEVSHADREGARCRSSMSGWMRGLQCRLRAADLATSKGERNQTCSRPSARLPRQQPTRQAKTWRAAARPSAPRRRWSTETPLATAWSSPTPGRWLAPRRPPVRAPPPSLALASRQLPPPARRRRPWCPGLPSTRATTSTSRPEPRARRPRRHRPASPRASPATTAPLTSRSVRWRWRWS